MQTGNYGICVSSQLCGLAITTGNEALLAVPELKLIDQADALEQNKENLAVHTNYAERRTASTGSFQED
jgi:hypothetical protein